MPKVSEQHREARREQILLGARRAFARYGYAGATVARLEEETGLSRGAIFTYFPNKWAIFYALAERDMERGLVQIVDEGFDALVRALVEEDPEWLGVYFELSHRLRTDSELRRQWLERALEDERRALGHMKGL